VLVRLGVKFGVNTGVNTELNPFPKGFSGVKWCLMMMMMMIMKKSPLTKTVRYVIETLKAAVDIDTDLIGSACVRVERTLVHV